MTRILSEYTHPEGLFSYHHSTSEHPKFVNFDLHTHNDYEVFTLLRGDIFFLVEGTKHHLNPHDILIIHGNELHQVFHRSDTVYERIVLNLSDRFFGRMECPEFRSGLSRRIIPQKQAEACGAEEIFLHLEQYIGDSSEMMTRCAVAELLYAFSRLPESDKSHKHEPEIVRYINEHLSEPLTLETLSNEFYLSKYYLCRLFKKTTGFTVNQYIITKRLLLVKQLCRDGKSLTEASAEAGFGCYENFYKAYVKAYGISPKKGLLEIHEKPII